jgi:hypothetical protein
MRWIILLLLTNYVITVHSQTWAGTFTLNSTCDTNTCCCLSNTLQLTAVSSTILAFNTSLAGILCEGLTSYSGQGTYPTGYTNTISVSIITLTMTLSNDSSMISITSSLGAACNVTGFREDIIVSTTTAASVFTNSSANTVQQNQNINLIILFSWVLLSIVMRN